MMDDPAFADYDEGTEMLMPDWFDEDFIQAVVGVAKELPGRDHIPTITPTIRKKAEIQKMLEMAARTREKRMK